MTRRSLRLTDTDRNHLVAAAAALGVEVSARAVLQLARFADLLDMWSRRVNLVSCHSSAELVDRHFLDSLAVSPLLPDSGLVVDLGSGAGFPGVPLAIVREEQSFVLVESRQKRSSFLAEVRRTLGMDHVRVECVRAEDPPKDLRDTASAVVSRAVWSDDSFYPFAEQWLADFGIALRMRSESQGAATPNTKALRFIGSETYRIGTDRPRFVDVVRKVEELDDVPRET